MSGHSTDSMVEFFQEAAKDTFEKSRGFNNKATRVLMVFGRYDSQYSAAPLAGKLSSFFGPKTSLFAPARSRNFQSTTRVAVTTAKNEGGTECIIANYNRPLGNWTRFEREDDAEKDMKIWEAGLATSAAPFYLPPFRKQPENADYIDGAVYANCPAKVAIEEVGKLFPNEGTSLDILLSLGTGHQTKGKPKIPKAIRYGVMIPIIHMFERQMDTGRTWDELVRQSTAIVQSRLHRLNPKIQGRLGGYVDINHHAELKHLLDSVIDWSNAGGAAHLSQISRVLIANLFFFEPDPEKPPKEGKTLSGSVRCRLHHGSQAVQLLLEKRVVGFWHTTVTKGEAPELHKLKNDYWRPVKDLTCVKSCPSQMTVTEGNIRKFRLNFELTEIDCSSHQVLAVQLVGKQDKIPISGFPATMEELNQRSNAQWLQ
jgi:predicted acylesterase/phospholipase RssA